MLELDATNSWVTEEEATSYFEGRMGAAAWDDLADPSDDIHLEKKKALVTAYRQINAVFSGMPSTATTAMKHAQCEQALFLLQQGTAIDLRKGIQAQGVTAAGVVKEQYDPAKAGELAIAPAARQLLKDYYKQGTGGLFAADLERDEEA